MKWFALTLCCLNLSNGHKLSETVTMPLIYTPLPLNQLFIHARKLHGKLSTTADMSLESGFPACNTIDRDTADDSAVVGEYSLAANLGSHSQEVALVLDTFSAVSIPLTAVCVGQPHKLQWLSPQQTF